MGRRGPGKGTQAKVVAEHFGIPRSRPATSSAPTSPRGTPLGKKAKEFMDAGEYVPDEVTNLMVRGPDRRARRRAPGFLLDGYPRTVAQVEELDGMVASPGTALDAVVVLTVDPGRARRRAAPARPERGPRRRHRGRHPPPPGGLRASRPSR